MFKKTENGHDRTKRRDWQKSKEREKEIKKINGRLVVKRVLGTNLSICQTLKICFQHEYFSAH
jgi:hypothetical protein